MDVDEVIKQLEVAQLGISAALGAFREIKKQMPEKEDEPLPVVIIQEEPRPLRPNARQRRERGNAIREAEALAAGAAA